MADTTTGAQVLLAAAAKARAEATELAKQPAPSLAGDGPDVDAVADHLKAMREMKIRYGLAQLLETEAETWAGDEVHNRCSAKTCTLDAALALARAVLAAGPTS